MKKIHQYALFSMEIMLEGKGIVENAAARFVRRENDVEECMTVGAYQKHGNVYGIHFMPQKQGLWEYETVTGERGSFLCVEPLYSFWNDLLRMDLSAAVPSGGNTEKQLL